MAITDILDASGLTYRKTRFTKPPATTYAVYMDDVETSGPDYRNMIYTHNYTVEIYEPSPDDDAESALEDAINAAGFPWTKQDRYWLQDEQRYQVIYEFSEIEKRS